MKRKNNLYENIYDFRNICYAFNEVSRNTKNKVKVNNFKDYKCINITRIHNVLEKREYEIGKYNIFKIYEPKERIIVSQKMSDKIINHLISRQILYPALLPCLIAENVASREGMGTKAGLNYFYNYNRICDIKYRKYYIIKGDISKYFYSIDHDILKAKLLRKIKDKDALNIVFKVIDSYENGLGIGNMTSQVLAVFFLNDFDHFIKEQLKIKYYVRFQDDFLIYHESKEYLQFCLKEIRKFLSNEKLTLNRKTRIFSNKEQFIFLGRKKKGKYANYRRIRGKLQHRFLLYKNNEITLNNLINSIQCYKSLDKKTTEKALNLIKHKNEAIIKK